MVQGLRRWLGWVEDGLGITFLLIMIGANAAQVVWRTILGDPLSWSEEAARVSFIWVVYLGIIRAFRNDTHLSVNYFVLRLPPLVQAAVAVAVRLLSVGFFAAFLSFAVQLTGRTAGMTLAVLPLPAAAIYASGVLAGALSLVHLLLGPWVPDATAGR